MDYLILKQLKTHENISLFILQVLDEQLFKRFIYTKVWTLRTAEFQEIYEQFPFYFV